MTRSAPVTDPIVDVPVDVDETEAQAAGPVSVADEGVEVSDGEPGEQGVDEIDENDESATADRGDADRHRVRRARTAGAGDSSDEHAPVGLLTIVLGVLAVLGLAGTLFFGFAWNAERTSDNAEQSMKTTAGDFLTALFDFDGNTIEEDFDNILSYATGDFADQAEARFADDDTRNALREARASSRVEIRDIFVQSFDGDRGRVFAIVDQQISNSRLPNPLSDQVRVEVTMRKVDGEWKVSVLDVLEAPAAQAALAGGTVPTDG